MEVNRPQAPPSFLSLSVQKSVCGLGTRLVKPFFWSCPVPQKGITLSNIHTPLPLETPTLPRLPSSLPSVYLHVTKSPRPSLLPSFLHTASNRKLEVGTVCMGTRLVKVPISFLPSSPHSCLSFENVTQNLGRGTGLEQGLLLIRTYH